ncbi:hypothetical protein H0O02_02035 [Candidatus Micrarchaeota archaeon]|nr:hypothetical protein [Candidatus Micrarchaeota archaeon]
MGRFGNYPRIGALAAAGLAGMFSTGCGPREGPDMVSYKTVPVIQYQGELPPNLNLKTLLHEELNGAESLREWNDFGDKGGLDFFVETGQRGVEYRIPFIKLLAKMNPYLRVDIFDNRLKGNNGLSPDLNEDCFVGNPKRGLKGERIGSLRITGICDARGRLIEKYVEFIGENGHKNTVFLVNGENCNPDPMRRQKVEILP